MTNDEFQIWLSGYIALENDDAILSAKQLWIIHNHLQLVQTVTGSLTEENQWLQHRLQTLRSHMTPSFMSNELVRVTAQLRNWLATLA